MANPDRESRATYPRFFNDSDGDLYFIFRQGGSGGGDTLFRRYNSQTGSWQQTGMLISREGRYPDWDNSTSRNAYINGIGFDANDRLHLSWIFRETGATPRSNHDVHYAYSDDHGTTWFNNAGTKIADMPAKNPIQLADPGIVAMGIPIDSGLRGQVGMAFDSKNQPHMLNIRSTVTSPDQAEWNLHYVHHWRTPDGAWHEAYLDDVDAEIVQKTRRGALLLDEQDNVHAYLPHAGELYAASATAESGWTDWSFYRLADGISNSGGVEGLRYDEPRFERDGIVSLPVETVTDAGTGFELLEFTVEEVTVDQPPADAPELTIRWDEPRDPHHGSASPGDRGFVLDWTAVDGASGYDIYRKQGNGQLQLIADNVGANSFVTDYIDSDVEPGNTYTYQVRAVNSVGAGPRSDGVGGTLVDRRAWDDYTIDVDLTGVERIPNLAFRIQDECNLYSWQVRTAGVDNDSGVRPVRIAGCEQSQLGDMLTAPFELALGQPYHFRLEVSGDTVTTSIDGQSLGTVTDGSYSAGQIGFRTGLDNPEDTTIGKVDNIRVTDADGDVLFEEDFSSNVNPFRAHGGRDCGGASTGSLALGRGHWCALGPYQLDLE